MRKNLRNIIKKGISLALTASLAAGIGFQTGITSYASDSSGDYEYRAPVYAMEVDSRDLDGDGQPDQIMTASVHTDAVPITDMLGCNTTSGYGMFNGNYPASLDEVNNLLAVFVWGSLMNEYPDPYYWNYIYNFYAAENGLETETENVLINPTYMYGDPGQADMNLAEE